MGTSTVVDGDVVSARTIAERETPAVVEAPIEVTGKESVITVVEESITNPARFDVLQEADDSLLIRTTK
jgi:hypothetical protein